MDVSSGSVSSGILSSKEDPRGLTFEAAWLKKPIMAACSAVRAMCTAKERTEGRLVRGSDVLRLGPMCHCAAAAAAAVVAN